MATLVPFTPPVRYPTPATGDEMMLDLQADLRRRAWLPCPYCYDTPLYLLDSDVGHRPGYGTGSPGGFSPMSPSTDSRMRSAWPTCRAYSSIRSISRRRRLGARPSGNAPGQLLQAALGQRRRDHTAGAGYGVLPDGQELLGGCPRPPNATPSRDRRPSPPRPTEAPTFARAASGRRGPPRHEPGARLCVCVGQSACETS